MNFLLVILISSSFVRNPYLVQTEVLRPIGPDEYVTSRKLVPYLPVSMIFTPTVLPSFVFSAWHGMLNTIRSRNKLIQTTFFNVSHSCDDATQILVCPYIYCQPAFSKVCMRPFSCMIPWKYLCTSYPHLGNTLRTKLRDLAT